jgi:tetratricopeptide (TPR) repeat protein
MELENRIMGVEREGDLPGELIPYFYFEYLRTREAFRLLPIFHHNAIDILSLACLTAIVPWAFHSPDKAQLSRSAEMVGLGRWLREAKEDEQALGLFRKAVNRGLTDNLMFRTLWDISALEKKLGHTEAALQTLAELAECQNPFRSSALIELAKHYEHHERNYAKALQLTRCALQAEDTQALRHREARLQRRVTAIGARV